MRPLLSTALTPLAAALVAVFSGTVHAQPTTSLPEVKVTTEGETAAGPVNGIVARRSATGTKTDTALIETPQSITVVTREQMDAQAADSLDQAFGYSAGISSQSGGVQRRTATGFTVRGFNITGSAPLYVNGSKFPINSLSGTMEPYAYERVELLKGPASILYGQAAPGGIINMVSKRPTAEPLREVEVQAGSWRRKQVAVDLGGPLTDDGRVGYRLTALARDAQAMVRQIPDDRTLVNAAIDWRLTDRTQLTLLATYSKGSSIYDYGKPTAGTWLPNVNGAISRTLFVGDPGLDKFDTTGSTLGYLLEHRFNDDWQFRQNILVFDYEADNAWAAIGSVVQPAQRLVSRSATARFDTDKGVSVDNQLLGKLRTGRLQHTMIVGLDYSENDFTRAQRSGTIGALDMYAPVYGVPFTLGGAALSISDRKQLGLYVQDHIKFDDRWIALLGGRYDDARSKGRSVTVAGVSTPSESKSHAFTPRAALMYLADGGIAPYYSYTRSFQPVGGTDFFLRPFKPTTGTQHEIGVKYEPPGMNASVTVAAYQLTQQNVSTTDLEHAGFSVQTGEIRSRGIEIEGRATIARRLDLIAALGTTDAVITQSNQGTVGSRPTSVPRHTASLWADYRLPWFSGVSVGAGVRHVGAAELNRLPTPSYTVFDAALRYQVDKWRFALNIKNLTDKTYLASCSFACFYGDERNVTLSARYTW